MEPFYGSLDYSNIFFLANKNSYFKNCSLGNKKNIILYGVAANNILEPLIQFKRLRNKLKLAIMKFWYSGLN